MISIKVEGLDALSRKLLEFGPKVAKNGLRAANFAGARVIEKQVELEIRDPSKQVSAPGEPPIGKSGQLEANVRTFRRTGPQTEVKHSIGLRGKRYKYADTSENRRKRRVGKSYVSDTRNTLVARIQEFGSVKQAARPFMRPAVEKAAPAAVEAVKARLAKAVEDAAKR